MPREGTKAAKIMRLYTKGLSTAEIARQVGCLPEYVRVVRYRASPRGQEMIKRANEAKREARKAYYRELYRTGDYELARRAYREASHA